MGVWVTRPEMSSDQTVSAREDKIAAIGVKIRKWITFHGISINVAPDLSHFDSIVPCGIKGHGVTSLADLGLAASLTDVDAALAKTFAAIFGDTPLQP